MDNRSPREEAENLAAAEAKEVDPEILRLVDRADSVFRRVRERARQNLRERGEEALSGLLAQFEQEHGRYQRRKRNYNRTIMTLLLSSIGLSMLAALAYRTGGPKESSLGVLIGISMACVGACGGFGLAKRMQRRHERVVKALSLFEDIRIVGPMAEALEYEETQEYLPGTLRTLAMLTLNRLLPRLGYADAVLLDGPQCASLCRAIEGSAEGFALKVLAALEYVGNSSALPYVRSYAAGKTVIAQIPAVQAAAQACLPTLERRAAEETARLTLLRGSGATEAISASALVLLRPAAGSGGTEAQQLLRPGVEESER